MTTTATTFSTPHALAPVPERPWMQRALPAVGAVYALAWLAGLLVAPATPGTADAGAVHAFFTAHAGAFVRQALLVHGLASLALVGLAAGFAVAVGRGRAGRWIAATGLAASGVSLLQVGLGLAAAHDVTHTPASTMTSWLQAVNIADVAKLLLLAAFAAVTTRAAGRAGRLPRWLRLLGWFLVPLLAVGGLAFLVPTPVLTVVLTASLPTLLAWAGAAAWGLRR
jgi:hypothetical protein